MSEQQHTPFLASSVMWPVLRIVCWPTVLSTTRNFLMTTLHYDCKHNLTQKETAQ
jgi:hypothetical protein